MENQTIDAPPQFDLSSAVPETEDGNAVSALPDFDLKSAIPEESLENAKPENNISEGQALPLRQDAYEKMKAGIEQIPPSPLSVPVREFINNFGRGEIENFKEKSFDYERAANIPTQKDGESDQEFNKRMEEFRKPLEDREIAKGAIGQLSDTFNIAAIVAGPEMSPKAWATFGSFMLADTTRQSIQNILNPNLTPTEKDVLSIVSFPLEGGLSHGVGTALGEMFSKAFMSKGVPPIIELTPQHIDAITKNPDISDTTKTDLLERLGVTQNHIAVAELERSNIAVPIINFMKMAESPHWSTIADEFKLQAEEQGKMVNEGGLETPQDKGIRLTHDDALAYLGVNKDGSPIGNGRISVSSSSGILGQEKRQTGLEEIKKSTLDVVKNFSDINNVDITITGGTEKGEHNDNLEFSHKNGDKLDLRLRDSPEINNIIESWDTVGERPLDGAKGFKDPNSNAIFWKEGGDKPHWDVEVRQGGGNAESPGRSAQEGSGKETSQGQAQAIVHLRDDGQTKEVSGEEINSSDGERITSKIAKSIEQKAIDAKLTDKFDTLAGEEKVNVAEQSEMATKLVNSNIDNARAMIRGEKPLPERLRGISLITAMEEHLRDNPDGDIAYELANSPLVAGTTRAAQELRLAAEREPDSFTQKMNEIKQSKIDAVGGQEKYANAKKDILNKLKSSTEEMNLSDKELGSFDEFFKGIEC